MKDYYKQSIKRQKIPDRIITLSYFYMKIIFQANVACLEKLKITINTSFCMSQNKTILKFKPHYFRRAIYFKQVAIFFPSPSPQYSVAIHLSQFSSSLFFRIQLQPLKQSSISNGNLHIQLFELLSQTLNKLPQVVELVMTLSGGGLS